MEDRRKNRRYQTVVSSRNNHANYGEYSTKNGVSPLSSFFERRQQGARLWDIQINVNSVQENRHGLTETVVFPFALNIPAISLNVASEKT